MKLNKVAVSALLTVVACGFAGAASAHTYAGTINANGGANRHDLIQTTCFSWANGVHPAAVAPEVNGPATRFVASLGGTGSAAITIQALPNGAVVSNAVASLSTATQTAGSFPAMNNGVYFVKINRAVSGAAVNYTATFHCTNTATGGINAPHTGTGESFAGDVTTVGTVSPTVDYLELINQ